MLVRSANKTISNSDVESFIVPVGNEIDVAFLSHKFDQLCVKKPDQVGHVTYGNVGLDPSQVLLLRCYKHLFNKCEEEVRIDLFS